MIVARLAMAEEERVAPRADLKLVSHADLALGLEHVLRETRVVAGEHELRGLRERRLLVLLDGVDELHVFGDRHQSLAAVVDAAGAFPHAKYAVATRAQALPSGLGAREQLFGPSKHATRDTQTGESARPTLLFTTEGVFQR